MEDLKTVIKCTGPTKLKDGLWMGDEIAAHDWEWVTMNHVTHIINCCGRDVSNAFEPEGIQYLTFPWTESETQILFDAKDININQIVKFITEAHTEGGGVLVHSRESDSRSCCVLSAFFMRRYKWSLFKTLEFLNSRKEDVQLEPQFFQQLNNLHSKLSRVGLIKSGTWDLTEDLEPEEIIIRNTFVNAKMGPSDDPYFKNGHNKSKKPKIVWKDVEDRGKSIIEQFRFSAEERISASSTVQTKKTKIKSILKGSNKIFELKPEQGANSNSMSKERRGPLPSEDTKNRSSKSILQKDGKKTAGGINNPPPSLAAMRNVTNGELKEQLKRQAQHENFMNDSTPPPANRQPLRNSFTNNNQINSTPVPAKGSAAKASQNSGSNNSKSFNNENSNIMKIINNSSSLGQNTSSASSQTIHNKENIREFYQKSEVLKERNRINSFDRFKKGEYEPVRKQEIMALNTKKNSNSNENALLNTGEEKPSPLNNNWVIRTDFRNLKGMMEEEILKKQSKPIIIVKPNLNVTILSNAANSNDAQPPKRAASEKRKDNNTSGQNSENNSKEINVGSDIYMKALKERMMLENNIASSTLTSGNQSKADKPFVRKERSNSAKPKMQDSKARERELFTINNLLDMQCISKPKWKF